jgi:hypothetical protein
MKSVICTLFEGHYHYGVAALSNSLYKHGFRGSIYAGFRGELPKWALKGKKESIGIWKEAITLTPVKGLKLIFLPLDTSYNLANYKPDFMLELWQEAEKEAEALFYFDTDIVIDESWSCFEQWVNCGVALCEDVNSPLQEFHPRRVGWRSYYKSYNVDLQFKNQIYVNAGFVGLLRKDISFLKLWIKLQESMASAIGGLENSIFSNQTYNSTVLKMEGFQIFNKPDQDALNATIETYDSTISYFGKEGMGFISGKAIMFHALGSPKPWKTNHVLRAIQGRSPRKEDISYWENSRMPFLVHSKWKIDQKQVSMKIAKLIGRFYKA